MKRIGVEKARKRLKDGFVALERLAQAKSEADFEREWGALLSALNAVYVILGNSSGKNPKSEQWLGKLRKERRADAALQYLEQARHSHEHGIAQVIKYQPGGIGISGRDGVLRIERMEIAPGGHITEFRGSSGDGSPAVFSKIAPTFALVPVKNRGVEYHVPENFLGVTIDQKPLVLAHKVLEFMTVLFVQAEELSVD